MNADDVTGSNPDTRPIGGAVSHDTIGEAKRHAALAVVVDSCRRRRGTHSHSSAHSRGGHGHPETHRRAHMPVQLLRQPPHRQRPPPTIRRPARLSRRPHYADPETTILQADNTFHRSSAQRGDEAGGMTTFDASPRTPRASIAPARSRVSPQAGSVAASTVALMTVGSAPVAQQHLVASRHLGRLPNWTTSRWRIWEISAGEHYGQSAVSGVWLSAPGPAPATVSRRVPALPG